MPNVLITGGTGLVGRAIIRALLQKGYTVTVLSRHPSKGASQDGLRYAGWDPARGTVDEAALREADHIIHLAGAGVAEKRWTRQRKQEILDSRVQGGALISRALATIPNRVKAVLSASAIGWYGADPEVPNPQPFRESDPPAGDFLGDTCRQWEQSISPAGETGKRLVIFRIGIVLSKEGGALKEFIRPLRLGMAAILGRGSQVISWIHLDDLVDLFIYAMEQEPMAGVYNAVAPAPTSNRDLTLTLARKRNRFFLPFRVPSFVLKTVLGEMSEEVLKSATVSADKVLQTGFRFRFPDIHSALQQEVSR